MEKFLVRITSVSAHYLLKQRDIMTNLYFQAVLDFSLKFTCENVWFRCSLGSQFGTCNFLLPYDDWHLPSGLVQRRSFLLLSCLFPLWRVCSGRISRLLPKIVGKARVELSLAKSGTTLSSNFCVIWWYMAEVGVNLSTRCQAYLLSASISQNKPNLL
jgi:hypothetical protein